MARKIFKVSLSSTHGIDGGQGKAEDSGKSENTEARGTDDAKEQTAKKLDKTGMECLTWNVSEIKITLLSKYTTLVSAERGRKTAQGCAR